MQQSKLESLIEACINVLIGFGINLAANAIILPMVGIPVTLSQNLLIGVAFTVISIARQYTIRRWAQRYLTSVKEWVVFRIKKGNNAN